MTSRVQDEHDVIIVGGGFAGLSLAIALRQGLGAGASIVVVDRAEAAGKAGDPRAYALGAGSVRMLEALGVWQAVAAASQPVAAIDITDSPLETAVRPVLLSYDNHLDQGEPTGLVLVVLWMGCAALDLLKAVHIDDTAHLDADVVVVGVERQDLDVAVAHRRELGDVGVAVSEHGPHLVERCGERVRLGHLHGRTAWHVTRSGVGATAHPVAALSTRPHRR